MTERVDPAVLRGGPLDGQTFKPVSQWPSYLTDAGEVMPAATGDRVFNRARPVRRGSVASGYRLTRHPNGTKTYDHSSAILGV